MREQKSIYQGCLLGCAVGDAMGFTVDARNYEEICRDYGPNGLLGYDLVNGYADVTSHTQLAAFVCNGLLVGITRGQTQGRMAPFSQYIALAMREWAVTQRFQRDPEKLRCWLSQVPELRRRHCMDLRMLDALSRPRLGTLEEPINRLDTPGSLAAAIAAGMFFIPERMRVYEVGKLGAEAVALTHGESSAFITGAALAYIIAGTLQDRDTDLRDHFRHAADAVAIQFGREHPQAHALKDKIYHAIALAQKSQSDHATIMNSLDCSSAAQVLCGAVYAALACQGDFDSAMIIAVNHSGRSAAVGAVTGAILGAKLGVEALPEFYLECLEPAGVLMELAADFAQGCPLEKVSRLFDDDWDQKYIHGDRVEKSGWYTE